jgi:hypothetical protein
MSADIPNIDKWYEVKLESYKFIFTQAEKKLEDILTESESITNKSIKMIAYIGAMFAFFVGFISQKHLSIYHQCHIIILFVLDVSLCIYLTFPKEVKGRGFIPNELIPERFDDKEDSDYQEQLINYCAIVKLERDIKIMRDKNSNRAKVYLACLLITLLLFIFGSIFIIGFI